MISARAFPTHCKTKTTPTRRSNVFTPAISKFLSSQYPSFFLEIGVRLSHAPTPLPSGLRNSPASPAAFKTESCLRCTRCTELFLFQRVPHTARSWRENALVLTGLHLQNKQNIIPAEEEKVLHLNVHSSPTHWSHPTCPRCTVCVCVWLSVCEGENGLMRSWRRQCAPSVISSSEPMALLLLFDAP